MFNRRKLKEQQEKITELERLLEKVTNQLIKVDRARCKELGISYDSL